MRQIKNRKTKRSPLTNKTNLYNNSIKPPKKSSDNLDREKKTLGEEGIVENRRVAKKKRTNPGNEKLIISKKNCKESEHKLRECSVNINRLGNDVISKYISKTTTGELRSRRQNNTKVCKTPVKNLQPKVYLQQIKIQDLSKKIEQNNNDLRSRRQSNLNTCKSLHLQPKVYLEQDLHKNTNQMKDNKIQKQKVIAVKSRKSPRLEKCKDGKLLKNPEVILEKISVKNLTSTSNKGIKTASEESIGFKKRLRKQKPVNYRNSSLNDTKKSGGSPEKCPVYSKPLKKSPPKKARKKVDVYEFNEFSSSNQESDSENDRTIHELLKRLQKKDNNKKQPKKPICKPDKRQKQNVIKNAFVPNSVKNTVTKIKPTEEKKTSQQKIAKKKSVQNESAMIGIDVSMPYVCEVPSKESHSLDDQNKTVQNAKNEITVQGNGDGKYVSRSSQTEILDIESENSNDTILNFDSIQHDQSDVSKERINIISDVVILPEKQTKKDPEVQPWRPEFPMLKRNPHLLYINKTALPCINQEMVVDSALVEKCATPKHMPQMDYTLNQEKLTQKSILDFMKNSPKKVVEKNTLTTTLFDCGDLSPIKLNKSPNKVLREINSNYSPNRIKRNILQSTVVGSTPLKLNKKSSSSKNKENVQTKSTEENVDEHTYFGFDDSDSSDVPNGDHNNSAQKPTRLSLKKIKNILKENKNEKSMEHEICDVEEQKDANDDENNQTSFEPKLFEDLEITRTEPASKSYKPRRQKRVRLPYYASDDEEANETHSVKSLKKKKKDVRSKAEDEEAEKWAEAFNAMCEEISKHNLEVE